MQMNRHCRLAHGEELRDLFRRSVIQVEQDEGSPLPGRELRECEQNLQDSIVDFVRRFQCRLYVSPLPDLGARDEMWQALLRLPERQRTAIVLRYYEDLSEAQTADTMRCPQGTVKSLVSRGLDRLRQEMTRDA